MADAKHGQDTAPVEAGPPYHRKKHILVGAIAAILLICLGAVLMKQALHPASPPAATRPLALC